MARKNIDITGGIGTEIKEMEIEDTIIDVIVADHVRMIEIVGARSGTSHPIVMKEAGATARKNDDMSPVTEETILGMPMTITTKMNVDQEMTVSESSEIEMATNMVIDEIDHGPNLDQGIESENVPIAMNEAIGNMTERGIGEGGAGHPNIVQYDTPINGLWIFESGDVDFSK
jgi:hypothetical protein